MAKRKKKTTTIAKAEPTALSSPALLTDIRAVIDSARQQTARAVNSALVTMYWQIGRRIRQDVLGNERAEYGKEILSTLSKELKQDYGSGFTKSSLSRMMSELTQIW
jgi:hypothetical protein